MPELSDNEILGVLGRLDQEQKFFDQMRAAWKQVGEVIVRYKTIQEKMPALAAEEKQLKDSIASVTANIASVRRDGEIKMKAEHDQLRAELREQIGPLQAALEEAKKRVRDAETLAASTEQECTARVNAATQAAHEAEQRRSDAESALKELTNRLVVR